VHVQLYLTVHVRPYTDNGSSIESHTPRVVEAFAVHLAQHAAHVTLLVRADTLARTMSDYLIRIIDATSNITVRHQTEVIDGSGEDRLTSLVVKDRASGATETVPAGALFILIGAQPHTSWLPEAIQRDQPGFILRHRPARQHAEAVAARPGAATVRDQPAGVFAVGDVRHGSTKRVASAVGEGSVAVRQVHQYLPRT
jgi:thioredoxin reductase (NADPH)